ncbi:hypothetical protein [Clostridium uliginosum]|uniref:Uncharacterized protein n=1 Tax=Clostridium uliginosum TaxID=119641 RepID=A0A1I1GZT0_9CLOT|nr:hypothetical protein [Clostridium uliginosum]SFC17015.1 hypothetical protein SAMN05421842_101117 [Clostridium uliginosum]
MKMQYDKIDIIFRLIYGVLAMMYIFVFMNKLKVSSNVNIIVCFSFIGCSAIYRFVRRKFIKK